MTINTLYMQLLNEEEVYRQAAATDLIARENEAAETMGMASRTCAMLPSENPFGEGEDDLHASWIRGWRLLAGDKEEAARMLRRKGGRTWDAYQALLTIRLLAA